MDREKGIQAIIDLQSMMDIEETRESAEMTWDNFTEYEKTETMHHHRIYFSNPPPDNLAWFGV